MARPVFYAMSEYDRSRGPSGGQRITREDIDAYFDEVGKELDARAWWDQQMRDMKGSSNG